MYAIHGRREDSKHIMRQEMKDIFKNDFLEMKNIILR